MSEPRRIRLSRAKGFRLADVSDNYKVVSRPSKFGNPFTVADCLDDDPTQTVEGARARCVRLFKGWLAGTQTFSNPDLERRRTWIFEHLHELRGKDLACWCPLPADGQEDHCHAAVLLALANEAEAGQ